MNELLEFILQARQMGQTNDQIMEALLASGWSSDQIAAGLLEADKQIPPIFAIPVERLEQEQTLSDRYVPDPVPVTPPPEMVSTDLTSSAPTYVNESAIQEVAKPKKNPKRTAIIVACVVVFLSGVGFVFWKGFTPVSFTTMEKTQVTSPVFAEYEPIKKDTAVLLNDSVQFTITGFQLMTGEEFNALQEGGGSTVSDGHNALLVYYTLQNLSEDATVISLTDDATIPFSLVDSSKVRVDIDSGVLSESIENLSELKPRQYTSNALIFEIPDTISNIHDLYFLLQSSSAEPSKGYIQL